MDNGNGTNNMVMPVSPMMGGYGNGGFGWGGDETWWLIILFLFASMSGWGGFGGVGGMNGMLGVDFPWLMNGQQGINANTNAGFNQAAIQGGLGDIRNALTAGFGDVQLGLAGVNQNLCQTGNSIMSAMNAGFNNAEVSNNARQIANMQQAFNSQTATTQAIQGVQNSLNNCCAENRLGIADLKYTVATENCADRTQSMQNTRDIIDAINARTQGLHDKLCQLEMDGYKAQLAQAQRDNVGLQNQLNMATLRESQTAQNALITQGFANEVDALYNRLNSCPVSTVPVYGKQPIFTCNQGCNGGCGY